MASTESSTDPTDLRTLSDAASDDASGGCVRRQSSTYIYVVDMTVSGQPLPDVVSGNNRDEEPDDHYDKIGSLQRENMGYTKSRSGTLTSEDMASGQSVAPYSVVRHLQQSVVPPQDPGTRQWCSWKRCVFVGLVVTVTIVLLSGLITVTALLLSRQAEQTRGDITLPISQPTLTASATTDVSTISTSTTTGISNLTSTASTTTQSSFSSTTTTPATSESCIRKYISCTSYNTRCPANGMIVEGDPGEVIDCPCNTACYSDIRYDDEGASGEEVEKSGRCTVKSRYSGYYRSSAHRGCTGD